MPDSSFLVLFLAPVRDYLADEPAKKGCRASLSVGSILTILLSAAFAVGKKRDRL